MKLKLFLIALFFSILLFLLYLTQTYKTPKQLDKATKTATIQSVKDLGSFIQPSNFVRDGTNSVLIGNEILWTFGDTLLKKPAVDGANYRSNTAALSTVQNPLLLKEPLDGNGDPYQFIDFTKEEEDFNKSFTNTHQRIAIWPSSLVQVSGGGAVFYTKLKINPGILNYQPLGVGIATVNPGQTTASRLPDLLFTAPETLFNKAVKIGPFVYLYGCKKVEESFKCKLAKVAVESINQKDKYDFWNGTAWSNNLDAAAYVLDGPSGGLSVSWNSYLHKYLAIYNQALSNRILLKTADNLQGPWSQAVVAFTGMSPAQGKVDYGGIEHPELAEQAGKIIYVSYTHPNAKLVTDIRLVQVTFR